jgi:hypothetical protein
LEWEAFNVSGFDALVGATFNTRWLYGEKYSAFVFASIRYLIWVSPESFNILGLMH